jgi:hypothetical protein
MQISMHFHVIYEVLHSEPDGSEKRQTLSYANDAFFSTRHASREFLTRKVIKALFQVQSGGA